MAKKKNKQLFETMVFDDYAEAQEVVESAKKKNIRILIGLVIAAIATYQCLSNFSLDKLDKIFVGMLLGVVAYIICGGIGHAIRFARKLAVFGWIILPFPIDIFTGLFTFVVSLYGFFCIPVIFVFMNYIQHSRDLRAAQKHLNHYTSRRVE